jgi:hypothetical protein
MGSWGNSGSGTFRLWDPKFIVALKNLTIGLSVFELYHPFLNVLCTVRVLNYISLFTNLIIQKFNVWHSVHFCI